MRIGAIFNRGSCRALKWTALFGLVFALAAGSVSAQVTYSGIAARATMNEGDAFNVNYDVKLAQVANGFGGGTLQITLQLTGGPGASNNPRDGRPTASEGNLDMAGVNAPNCVVPENNSGAAVAPPVCKGTLRAVILTDVDAEDEVGQLAFSVTNTGTVLGADNAAVPANTNVSVLTIRDRHEQTFVWEELDPAITPTGGGPVEGAQASILLRAVPAPEQYQWNMNARTNSNSYTLSSTGQSNQVVAPGPTVRITLDSAGSDGNREDDEVEMTLYYAGSNEKVDEIEPYTFTFKDIHSLPTAANVTWKAYADKEGSPDKTTEVTSIMEGGDPVHVEVTVARGAAPYPTGETLKLEVMPDNAGQALDYRLENTPIDFTNTGLTGSGATGNRKTGTFRVFASADDDIGDEDLVLNLRVTGKTATNGPGETMAAKSVMLKIEDATEPLLTTKTDEEVMAAVAAARTAAAGDDDEWTPGEMFTLMERDLFNMLGSNHIDLAASSDSERVSVSTTGDTVMLTARAPGVANIKVTGTVTGSSVVSQTRANVATVEFEVEVDELDLAITLSGPADMNIAEGMSAMVTATANRAVNANTMVELVGTGGSASPNDWSAEDIMIMAGEMTGTTMLMANEDSMEESMETLTIEGRSGSMKTNMLTFNLWDAAVPALPVIAQLLLAAFLAIGGYRRYLRR